MVSYHLTPSSYVGCTCAIATRNAAEQHRQQASSQQDGHHPHNAELSNFEPLRCRNYPPQVCSESRNCCFSCVGEVMLHLHCYVAGLLQRSYDLSPRSYSLASKFHLRGVYHCHKRLGKAKATCCRRIFAPNFSYH